MTEVEYIVAKSLTRTNLISLADWNKNWHDHAQEIATGRVQVLDVPDDQAKAVADIVSKSARLSLYEKRVAAEFDRIEPLAAELDRSGASPERPSSY
jgi:uncharacterized Rmd1/YagE family protein